MNDLFSLFNTQVNSADLSHIPRMGHFQKQFLRGQADQSAQEQVIQLDYMNVKFKIKVPLITTPDEVGEVCVCACVCALN